MRDLTMLRSSSVIVWGVGSLVGCWVVNRIREFA